MALKTHSSQDNFNFGSRILAFSYSPTLASSHSRIHRIKEYTTVEIIFFSRLISVTAWFRPQNIIGIRRTLRFKIPESTFGLSFPFLHSFIYFQTSRHGDRLCPLSLYTVHPSSGNLRRGFPSSFCPAFDSAGPTSRLLLCPIPGGLTM